KLTWIDRWFLNNIRQIVEMENKIERYGEGKIGEVIREAKEYGFSDKRIAELTGQMEKEVRQLRERLELRPVYKLVDTCAAEFEAYTPYLYSTYEKPFYKIRGERGISVECEANPTNRKKIVILGSGPNRIGQGIEFDYCCVHAVFALKELGYETIMVNCNPETVSTDYDTADRLYFEPLTIESVCNIIKLEKPEGVMVQFGGQTPLKLALSLEREGVKILGTSPDSIDQAEDRRRFKDLLYKLRLRQPNSGIAMSYAEATAVASEIGYPVMVRPSYVLGGRAMEIVYDKDSLSDYIRRAVKASPEHPILIDEYLEDAIEIDVDAISDGIDVIVGGVMEHIEKAGIHSGDSACSIPPYSLSRDMVNEIKRQTSELAKELNVIGLMNVQFAVRNGEVFVLEVNPRASRTIPYVSKVTGVPLAKFAAKVMLGNRLKELGLSEEIEIRHVAVKEAVFPFERFPGVDMILGPEMKSTGEVMGIDEDFGLAYAKAQIASKNKIPTSGRIFISVKDKDKPEVAKVAKRLLEMDFQIVATTGTAKYLSYSGIHVDIINKVMEGRPHIGDLIKNREIDFIINTVTGARAQRDSFSIRSCALEYNIPYTTTIAGAKAAVMAIESLLGRELNIKAIQEYHKTLTASLSLFR
ncbi:carbamoyl-phosphate synthase large subunit, partial [Thermodesulfovibrionales bacterium]|nr:carbamoyl-phosphate synthase large subunit [Thermodesulfovibrionales bacterium]